MKATSERTGTKDLRRCWRRWTSVVELFARRSGRRGRIGLKEYEALHAELLAVCRELAATAPETEQFFYQALEQLARPWLSPHTLEQADREILMDLFLRCREAGQRLGCLTWVDILGQYESVLLGLLATGVAVVLVATTSRFWWPVLDSLNDVWRTVSLAIKHVSPGQWGLGAGVIVILVAIILVWRNTRI